MSTNNDKPFGYTFVDIAPGDLLNLFIVADGNHDLDTRRHVPYVDLDDLGSASRRLYDLGVTRSKLFVYQQDKSEDASTGLAADNLMVRAIKTIKDHEPRMQVMTEVCACAYSRNGECVLLTADGRHIDDQRTHDYCGEMARLHVDAGCDGLVAGLTHDGSIRAMRQALDDNGHTEIPIMASIQFKSAYYGAYRAMMRTEPVAGPTFRSQIDPDDFERAAGLLHQYELEGASLFTVQPAMPHVDAVYRLARVTDKPITAFSVGSELACFTGPDRTLLLEKAAMMYEYFCSLRRAGASVVATYVAADFAEWLNKRS